MKRKTIVSLFFVMLFLVSVFPMSSSSGVVDSHGGSGFSGPQSTVGGFFDFKREIFGNLSSINVWVVNINNSTGEVTLNGVDTRRPTIPFTWDWDDGSVTTGWFLQTHTYSDKTRNYIVKVTSHYPEGETDSAEALIRFIPPAITPTPLPSNIAVSVPNHPVNLISRMPGYGIPASLTYFDDGFFGVTNRSVVEYILTAAASIQKNLANDNMYLIDGGFRQVLLRDPSFGGMYSLWYTDPVSIGAGDYAFQGSIQWSSIFHEMGHDVTLNSPSNYFYGGKIDGNANAIFSETMAQIFQHSTACELINNAGTYGLSEDMVFEIKQSAIQSMWIVRGAYENYVNSGLKFSSWNDPATPADETFDTFMTIAYKFFVHAENSGLGYRVPLKRMMKLLQTFGESDRERFSQYSNTPTAQTFRATLMVAALSYAFGEDLRTEFRDLNFSISDEMYHELIHRGGPSPNFCFAPSTPRVNETVVLNASASCSLDGTILSYAWDFGDGNLTTVTEPVISHTYIEVGNYTVTLNVTDNYGLWDTTTSSVNVRATVLLGDINQDIVVDIYDAILLANAYNSKQGDPNWNPNADINSDNIVDVYDAILLASNYGKTAP